MAIALNAAGGRGIFLLAMAMLTDDLMAFGVVRHPSLPSQNQMKLTASRANRRRTLAPSWHLSRLSSANLAKFSRLTYQI